MEESPQAKSHQHLGLADTIAAIATPMGEGGLGVIRISGSQAFAIAASLFHSSNTDIHNVSSHTLHHGWVGERSHKLDEAILAVFRAPRSYTGEDVVEVSCHGSPIVLKAVVDLCLSKGARLAKPGEFTERRFLNGKMDLSQAEAVADLVSAKSKKAQKVALDQLQGRLSHQIKTVRDPLIRFLAHLEANLDFVEEDLPLLSQSDLKKGVEEGIHALQRLLATRREGLILKQGLRVGIVGKPNVGKSSLFNALLDTDRAIVTAIPGTTRDVLTEQANWNGFPVVLIDTAGLRPTKDPVEKKGTQRAKRILETADVLIFVLDGSKPLSKEDGRIYKDMKVKKRIVAINKTDKKTALSDTKVQTRFHSKPIQTSALKGTGLTSLKEAIFSLMSVPESETQDTCVVTNMRHFNHLERSQTFLQKAQEAFVQKKSEEEVALDIRQAIRELDHITGESVSDDMLDAIFRQFCIGK